MFYKFAALVLVITACGLRAGPEAARDKVANPQQAAKKLSGAHVFVTDPNLDTYIGPCIETNNEPFLNNANERCFIAKQTYDKVTNQCTEEVTCENRDHEFAELYDESDVIP
jgi:hypothetical protein